MISGALLFNKEINNAEDIKKFYKHNLLSLLITSEIWMFIMYWVIYIMEGHFRTESIFMSILGLLETMFLSIKLYFPQHVVYPDDFMHLSFSAVPHNDKK